MTKKSYAALLWLCILLFSSSVLGQRKMENLDRGLTAVKVSNGVFLSWRLYGDEWYDVKYNVYRNDQKLNSEPLEVSNFSDLSGTTSSSYKVAAIVNGVEQPQSKAIQPWSKQYLEIPMVSRPNGYEVNDATTADLDGDGEYEIIVKRINQDWRVEATLFTYFEAYKLDGTLMWQINVGPNIMSSSSVEVNIAAFDFDEDGKAEVFLRTSEGTIFGDGTKIGDTDNDGTTNYRYSVVQSANMRYMNAGPEFLSLVDGETGAELDRVDYIPRVNSELWGDGYGHRANKFFFGAPYLDGKHPSLFIGRGIYTRTVMRAYDVVNNKLIQKWEFSTDDNPTYFGQGNHNYTIADVDEDGRDEIVWGSMTVDDDGTGLYSTELGHGDALHVGDLDPYRKGTEIFKCLEESPDHGTVFYDGATGDILIHHLTSKDCGRCIAGNFTNDIKGAELMGGGKCFSATTRKSVSAHWPSENFRIYWDGDLLEEFLDHTGKYDSPGEIEKPGKGSIFIADNTLSCNYTKGTPTLQADLFGDWREEVIWRTSDNQKIRIYTTVNPTPHRNYTLMHDHQYRQAICWQMCGYNQPPHVSYFLGEAEGILLPPPPTISNGRMVYAGTGTWDTTTEAWDKDGAASTYTDGDHVLFDVSMGEDVNVTLAETMAPSNMTVNSSGDYTIDASTGKLTGSMQLIKQGLGTFNLSGSHDFTGVTEIWTGRLALNGTLSNSPVWVNRFGLLEATGELSKGVEMLYGSSLYVGGDNAFANLVINESLAIAETGELIFDLHSATDSQNDSLIVNGKMQITDGASIRIIPHLVDGEEYLAIGEYVLATASEGIEGNVESIKLNGILGTPAKLEIKNNSIVLVIKEMRTPSTVYWNGNNSDDWDLATSANFLNNDTEDVFATRDTVFVNDNAASTIIDLVKDMAPAYVEFNNTKSFNLVGNGAISGTTSLTKKGTGKLTIQSTNAFTGKVLIEEGTIAVNKMPNHIDGNAELGAVSGDASKFIINGGELMINSKTLANRALTVGEKGATLYTRSTVDWKSKIIGGSLTKDGSGELILSTSNTNDELILDKGSVRLLNEIAHPGKKVTFKGGTLSCYHNTYTYSSSSFALEVPEGETGKMYLDGRCTYKGALTGSGNLSLYFPFVRSDLQGNWSNFAGVINIFSTYGDDIPCRFDNSYGYENATIILNDKVYAENIKGGTLKIGALASTAGGILAGGTWSIGHNNKDAIFRGTISTGAFINKYGSGSWTLPVAQGTTGAFNIYEGKIIVTNTSGSATGTSTIGIKPGGTLEGTGSISGAINISTTGVCNMSSSAVISGNVSMTGTLTGSGTYNGTITISNGGIRNGNSTSNGKVTVKQGGIVGGEGYLKGDVSIESGAIVAPGTDGIGKLTFYKPVTFVDGTIYDVEINRNTGEKDQISAMSSVTLKGALKITELSGTNFTAGESYKIIAASKINGAFDVIEPATPGEGLEWDFSRLNTVGYIGVKLATSVADKAAVGFDVYPNPGSGVFNVTLDTPSDVQSVEVSDVSGKVIYSASEYVSVINLKALPSGVYMLKIKLADKTIEEKLMIQ